MELNQIQKKREELDQKKREIAARTELLKGEFLALYSLCSHPNMKSGYSMGESCQWCPDCGYKY